MRPIYIIWVNRFMLHVEEWRIRAIYAQHFNAVAPADIGDVLNALSMAELCSFYSSFCLLSERSWRNDLDEAC